MKEKIHPKYEKTKVTCACGNEFETRSTMGAEIKVEICANCHPFFTGKQKLMDSAGRVEKFNKRYNRSKTETISTTTTAKPKAEPKAKATEK